MDITIPCFIILDIFSSKEFECRLTLTQLSTFRFYLNPKNFVLGHIKQHLKVNLLSAYNSRPLKKYLALGVVNSHKINIDYWERCKRLRVAARVLYTGTR